MYKYLIWKQCLLKNMKKRIAELEMENESLKVVTFMENHKKVYTIKRIYKVLNFPISTSYTPLLRVLSKRQEKSSSLKSHIYEF